VRASEPRERLLRVAGGLFYAKGIRAVGVDEVLATAGVTRSTLYRHFPGKDDLVVAYLHAASQAERAHVEELLAGRTSGADGLRILAGAVVGQLRDPAYRGCAFLNAAAEHPDTDHPVHQAVLEHRRWYAETVAGLVAEAGYAAPLAELFVLLRDGAMSAGCLSGVEPVAAAFTGGVEQLLRAG
jgi:AcrR family transcriptional regulator